ncbi:cytochrome b/b6 domain-containing protein [Frigidibacter sp. RF13]|uniref:cytochrome b n=1 Tax=Frigidibacter sp. RF13 TaxID=2997340 RepID=UPI00226DAF89|nr:cytochrome b/b6 domain-containing protein [Frigidibacter sp. RF13]MCY1126057.1 cytochrome b/b6 domain-containing protein [Frigidibacter sp. RF13]
MQVKTSYSGAQIALHWLIAVLILANYLLSEEMGDTFDRMLEGEGGGTLGSAFHVWAGVAVLILSAIRVVVRLRTGAPESAGAGLMDVAARWAHRLLYVLMLLVPGLGAYSWFAGAESTADLHELTANLLMAVAGLHALAALYHQYVLKDGLLMRMLRPN